MNSVLQALYFCKPFREKIIQYKLAYAQRTAHLGSAGGKENTSSQIGDNNNEHMNGGGGGGLNQINSSNGNLNTVINGNLSAGGGGVGGGGGGGGGGTTKASSSAPNGGSPNGIGTAGSQVALTVSILKQEHLLNCLAELFYSIVTMKKKKGIVQPKKFIARLRKDNGEKKRIASYLYANIK